MARELASKEIDGQKYECTQFDIRKSLKVMTRLGKHIGGPLGALIAKYDKEKGLLDTDVVALGVADAARQLFMSMDDDSVYELCKLICESVIAVGGPVGGQLLGEKFDMHFKGPTSLVRLYNVVWWALEVNYGDFIGAVKGGAGLQISQEAQAQTSTRVK